MLDEEHKQVNIKDARDNNSYVFGQIHEHNVVIACLPARVYGPSLLRQSPATC